MKPLIILVALIFCRVAAAQAPIVPTVQTTNPATVVVLYTSSNCVYCERWKQEVQPQMRGLGFVVVERSTRVGFVPRFEIQLRGYQGVGVFRRLSAAIRMKNE